jgi:hypothetical protein
MRRVRWWVHRRHDGWVVTEGVTTSQNRNGQQSDTSAEQKRALILNPGDLHRAGYTAQQLQGCSAEAIALHHHLPLHQVLHHQSYTLCMESWAPLLPRFTAMQC